jgi:hypothetical protein
MKNLLTFVEKKEKHEDLKDLIYEPTKNIKNITYC